MRRAQAATPLDVLLLAGGSGERFWPASRARTPKHLLRILGGPTLLERAWQRARALARPSRIWVVAPRTLTRAVKRQLPQLRADRLLVEPAARDSAPAAALACRVIAAGRAEAIVAVLPTDHVVPDIEGFARTIDVARRAAESGALVCVGVRADRPSSAYGYLVCRRLPRRGAAVPVERFVEKPGPARARRLLRSGRVLWNAGIFVWRAERFLDELARTAPEIDRAVAAYAAGARRAWARAPRRSIDHAVMEHARTVSAVPLDGSWDDLGSWDAAAGHRERAGPLDPSLVALDSPGSVRFGSSRITALVGVPNVVVVDTPDALLVVARSQAQRVREVVETLRAGGRDDVL